MKKLFIFSCLLVLAILCRAIGQEWETVGVSGFAESAAYLNIAFDGAGTPYVVYQDGFNNGRVTVKKFDGAEWVIIGEPFEIGLLNTSFVIGNNGDPYIACQDANQGNRAIVKRFNGSSWSNVGTEELSAGAAYNIQIACGSNNTLFIAYTDATNYKVVVKKFEGAIWENIGQPIDSIMIISSFAIDYNEEPYIAYQDAFNDLKASVKRFDGTSWVYLGEPGFSTQRADYPSIILDRNNVPYVVYKDIGNGRRASVKKYNGTSWVYVGNPGFSNRIYEYVSISIDNDGTLFVASMADWASKPITLQRFLGTEWTTIGTPVHAGEAINSIDFGIDNNYTPYLLCFEMQSIWNYTVLKFSSLPQVSANLISNITQTSASTYVTVTDNGCSAITARGICWNATGSPTTNDFHKEETGAFGTGAFSTTLDGLAMGQKYYVRAFATNAVGTAYGEELTFTTIPTLGQWGLIAFGGLIAMIGCVVVWRKIA